MSTFAYAIKALHPLSSGAHVLGMSSGRSSGSLVEVWNGATVANKVLAFMYRGDVVVGDGSTELLTTATGPFSYITGGNGAPTGVPTYASSGGPAPLYIDRANLRLYVYVGGNWRFAALT